MRVNNFGKRGLCLGMFFGLALAANLGAKDAAPKMMNYQGRVQSIDKNSSSITIAAKGNVTRQVMYGGDTKFMYGHSKDRKPGAVDQIKEGNYISCSGPTNKSQVMAKLCVYREGK